MTANPERLSALRQRLVEADTKPAAGSFLILDGRHVCQWTDVWMGTFTVPALAPNGTFYVSEFSDRLVVELTS